MSLEIVQKSLLNILEAVADAVATSGATRRCRLVAVSKTKPAELIEGCYAHGQRHFGENYVQELEEKSASLSSKCPEIRSHFIGQVQSNKISKVCNSPGIWCVETLESEKHARLFDKEWSKHGATSTPLRVLVQVNTSGEENKGGIHINEAPKLAEFIRKKCVNLKFDGFMTIGSFDNSHTNGVNPDFEKLFNVRRDWAQLTDMIKAMSDEFFGAFDFTAESLPAPTTGSAFQSSRNPQESAMKAVEKLRRLTAQFEEMVSAEGLPSNHLTDEAIKTTMDDFASLVLNFGVVFPATLNGNPMIDTGVILKAVLDQILGLNEKLNMIIEKQSEMYPIIANFNDSN